MHKKKKRERRENGLTIAVKSVTNQMVNETKGEKSYMRNTGARDYYYVRVETGGSRVKGGYGINRYTTPTQVGTTSQSALISELIGQNKCFCAEVIDLCESDFDVSRGT